MNALNSFCLASLVFMSLPLPLFASAAIGVCPSLRRSVIPLVWINTFIGATMGLLVAANSPMPLLLVAFACVTFIVCGIRMFRHAAKAAAQNAVVG